MAPNRDADLYLDGKPFMLSRATSMRGRAWTRTGSVDAPSRRSPTDTRYGVVADTLDHPEVWEDWSGDSGYAYRDPDKPTAIHWSENFERRFPGQLTHCQTMQPLPARYASVNLDVDRIADVPLPGVSSPPAGAGAVVLLGKGKVASLVPTGLSTTGSAFDLRLEATGGGIAFAGRPATFGSFTYLPNSAGSGFYRRGHDGTMTVSTMPASGFRVAGSRLWRYHSTNLLQSCAAYADPLVAGNWSATLPIGDGNKPIADMVDISSQLFCGLQDGLYTPVELGDLQNVLAALKDESNSDNCRDLAVFNTSILAPHLAGLMEYRQSGTMAVAREIGPNNGRSDRSPIKGRIRCTETHGPWAYAGLWTGSESYILTGRENANGYYWQTQQRIGVGKVNRIHFDGVTTASGGAAEIPTRMWVTTEKPNSAGTAPVYCMPIPRGHGNPLTAEPGFTPNFCGSARADLGRINWGAPACHKLFKSVEIRADNLLSGSRYADVYYTLDGGSRTLLGRAQDSPVSQLWFPVGTDRWASGKEIEPSIESFTTTPLVSPVYRSITVRGSLMPDTQDTITAVVRIADGIRDRSQHSMRDGAVMLEDLRTMADPHQLGMVPHLLVDLAGAVNWVNVLRPVSEAEVYQQGSENPEIAATVQLAILEMTVNPQLLGVGYEALSMATT